MRPTKSELIDLIKGVAVVLVVVLHAKEIFWIGGGQYIREGNIFDPLVLLNLSLLLPFSIGGIGVNLFFIVSGYCIHRAYFYKVSLRDVGAKRFLTRRILRLYPVYILGLILTLLLDSLSTSIQPDFYKLGDLSLSAFALNFLMLQEIFSLSYGSNGPLWSLSVEVHIYIVYLVLCGYINLSVSIRFLFGLFILNVLSIYFLDGKIFSSFIFSWFLGCFLVENEKRLSEFLFKSKSSALFVFVISIILIPVIDRAVIKSIDAYYYRFLLWSVPSFMLVLSIISLADISRFLVKYKSNFYKLLLLVSPSFVVIGKSSYSIYICHQPLLVFLFLFFLDGKTDQAFFVYLFSLLSVGFGYLVHRFYEKPISNALNYIK